MIKLTKLVELKPLNEQEVFTATNKETGNVSVFKSKASRDAAVKSGSHEMRKHDKEGGVEKPTSKVNIFNKDKKEPNKDTPKDSGSDDDFEFLDSFEMEEKLDSMDLSDDVRAELDRQIDYLQGQEYELENAREEGDDEAEAEIEDDIARTRDEIGKIFKSAKKNPSTQKPSKETPKSSSYSGDYQDMQKDMQNAFKSAGISNKVTTSIRFNDNHSQVHFEDEIDDDSLQNALDKFNQENGTNFQAGKVKRGPKGWFVAISEDPTHKKLQEQENTSMKLTKLVELKPLHEAEEDKYTHIGFGKFKEKGKEDDENAPTFEKDGDKFVPISSHAAAAKDAAGKEDKPKVNIFNKDKQEPKSSSYSGNSEDMKMDMQNAFEDGYTGKGLKGVKKTKDGFQINMASYMNDNSFKDVLDSLNKTNGTNFVAGKIEKTAGGTRVIISEPSKEEPKSQPSQPKRQGNPEVNKATLSKAKELGITPQKLGKEEYQKKMAQAAVAALTDANFHSEARELISKLEGKPEWAKDPRQSAPKIDSPEYDEWRKSSVYSSEYYDADDATEDLGVSAAQEAGWSGDDAADSIAFTLRMNGFHKMADTIQSVIKENKSTRLKDLV